MTSNASAGADLEVALVTGMSGAGRSTAARALEDLGWFVIDNLPPSLLQQAVQLARASDDITKMAVVVDVRGKTFFSHLNQALETLPAVGIGVRTLFLESSDEALVRRFESSRRPHPLQGSQRIVDGLQAERTILGDLRANADVVIDTSTLNVHDLRRKVEAAFADDDPTEQDPITVDQFTLRIDAQEEVSLVDSQGSTIATNDPYISLDIDEATKTYVVGFSYPRAKVVDITRMTVESGPNA